MTTSVPLLPYDIGREDRYFQSLIPAERPDPDLDYRVAVDSSFGEALWQQFCKANPQNNVEDWAWQACLAGPQHEHYEEAGWEIEDNWVSSNSTHRFYVRRDGGQILMFDYLIGEEDGFIED